MRLDRRIRSRQFGHQQELFSYARHISPRHAVSGLPLPRPVSGTGQQLGAPLSRLLPSSLLVVDGRGNCLPPHPREQPFPHRRHLRYSAARPGAGAQIRRDSWPSGNRHISRCPELRHPPSRGWLSLHQRAPRQSHPRRSLTSQLLARTPVVRGRQSGPDGGIGVSALQQRRWSPVPRHHTLRCPGDCL